jgi:hypothetical protein
MDKAPRASIYLPLVFRSFQGFETADVKEVRQKNFIKEFHQRISN